MSDLYARPDPGASLDECEFYHSMEIPGFGEVHGAWDLRGREADYWAHTSFAGQRVLELGPASGHLTHYMEARGADVTSIELAPDGDWDMIPFAAHDFSAEIEKRRAWLGRMYKGYWLAHRARKMTSKVIYGSIYAVPEEAGPFDIATFGSILLHLQNPFAALAGIAPMVGSQIVIAEVKPRYRLRHRYRALVEKVSRVRYQLHPTLKFLGDYRNPQDFDTWWEFSPEVLQSWLQVLGFADIRIHWHSQLQEGKEIPMFTIVGKRTSGP